MSREEPQVSREEEADVTPKITPEFRLVLRAVAQLSQEGIEVEMAPHRELLRALDNQARLDGAQIFNAALFLESALERGAVPRYDPTKKATIPLAWIESVAPKTT